MTTVYLSVPYQKEDAHGDAKKDIDESLNTKIANGYILNRNHLKHFKSAETIKIVMIDRVRKRRAEGYASSWTSTGVITRFGERHDFLLSELTETQFSPVVFKYHRTGVKVISPSGQDIK